jgi:hypothetical protein
MDETDDDQRGGDEMAHRWLLDCKLS